MKCLECGRSTMYFELGEVYCEISNCTSILAKNKIICPKCNKDISKGKCAVKIQDIVGMFIAANLLVDEGLPKHLQGAASLRSKEFQEARLFCESVLTVTGNKK
jgi:TFIIF-interacting CTD phosphatase-like protein